MVGLPCRCKSCLGCIKRQFELFVDDPMSGPPTHCNERVPVHLAAYVFPPEFKKTFNQALVRFEERGLRQCPLDDCDGRVSALCGKQSGWCRDCWHEICAKCDGKMHPLAGCTLCEDGGSGERTTDPALDDLVQRERLMRCFQCRNVVERDGGCNHITWYVVITEFLEKGILIRHSRCGAQFCYACGRPWGDHRCGYFRCLYAQVDGTDPTGGSHRRPPGPGTEGGREREPRRRRRRREQRVYVETPEAGGGFRSYDDVSDPEVTCEHRPDLGQQCCCLECVQYWQEYY